MSEGSSACVEGHNLTGNGYISTVAIARAASARSKISHPGTGRAVFSGARFRW